MKPDKEHDHEQERVTREFLKRQPKETQKILRKVLREKGLLGKDSPDDDSR